MLIITHTDLDGVGCAVLAKALISRDIEVIYTNYNLKPPKLEKLVEHKVVFMTDISFPEDYIEDIEQLRKIRKVTPILLDHHDSAKEVLEPLGFDWLNFDMTRSGTKMFYDYLASKDSLITVNQYKLDQYKRFTELVNDYDLWIHEFSRSKDLNLLYSQLGKDDFLNYFVNNPEGNWTKDFKGIFIKAKYDLKQSYQQAVASMKFHTDKEGLKFGLCSTGRYHSLVAEMLKNDYPDLDYFVLVRHDIRSVSFRSKEKSINHIAESLGGGGHPLSAGTSYEELMDVANSVINRDMTYYKVM